MEKIIFEDLPSTKTPLNAKNLNQIQYNVEQAIEEIKEIILKSDAKILWTNSNPTIAFEPQAIELSSDDYDFYEIITTPTIETVDNYIEIVKGVKGKGTYLKYFASDGAFYRRTVDYVNDIQLNIGVVTNATGTIANSNIIPLYVIGYKIGLFE